MARRPCREASTRRTAVATTPRVVGFWVTGPARLRRGCGVTVMAAGTRLPWSIRQQNGRGILDNKTLTQSLGFWPLDTSWRMAELQRLGGYARVHPGPRAPCLEGEKDDPLPERFRPAGGRVLCAGVGRRPEMKSDAAYGSALRRREGRTLPWIKRRHTDVVRR
jgi:hypothetical protein